MNHETFCDLTAKRFQACQDILARKSKEYSRSGDKLHNFRRASALLGCSPEKALAGMMTKHIVSVLDLVDDIDSGDLPQPDMDLVHEKIGDLINYSILLEALITERRQACPG